jgi:hypothetical protein
LAFTSKILHLVAAQGRTADVSGSASMRDGHWVGRFAERRADARSR